MNLRREIYMTKITEDDKVEKRFFEKIEINDNNCWVLKASDNLQVYGQFYYNGKTILAHRFSFEYFKEKIEPNNVIDHICKNTLCVNPNHLEQVTTRENVMRGMGVTSINDKKTHCSRGHLLEGENVYSYGKNYRQCMTCR